jgi:hypothetical protein
VVKYLTKSWVLGITRKKRSANLHEIYGIYKLHKFTALKIAKNGSLSTNMSSIRGFWGEVEMLASYHQPA